MKLLRFFEAINEGAAIRTYDPGVVEWLQEALSRPDADELYLHGSRQVQDVFSPEGKRHEHSLLHFSKLTDPQFQGKPHHAEYYGSKLWLCKLNYSKPFDVRYPDKEPAQMYQELVPHGRKYQLDYGDIYHIIEPALAKGYDMFVVWEVSVSTESYAVPDANQVVVVDTYDSRITEARRPAMVVKDVYHASGARKKFTQLSTRDRMLFFSKKPRTAEFGKRVFFGDVWFNNPFMFNPHETEQIIDMMPAGTALNIVAGLEGAGDEDMEEMLQGQSPEEYLLMMMDEDEGAWQHPEFIQGIKNAGYDGVISNDPFGGGQEYVIFNDKQFISKGQYTAEARPKNIDPYQAAVMIAKDDDLFDTVAAYTGDIDVWDNYPKELAKFIAILNLIKPYRQRLYRGERGYFEQRDGTTHYYETNFPFTSWSLNKDTAQYFVEGGILSYTDGPIKAVSLSDVALARNRMNPGESHYSGAQAEYFVLEPVPRANVWDLNEARNPDVRVKKFGGGIYRAYLGRTKVGHAQLNDFNSDDVADDERYIWKSAVHPDYLRQGVATELYNVIADDVGAKGLKLVPSPDTQLSKDAYEFWKARDPESIKGHGKYKAEPYQKYIGREIVVTREGGQRPAVVTHVGWGRRDEPDLGIRYTDVPKGSVNSQSQVYLSAVKDQLQ